MAAFKIMINGRVCCGTENFTVLTLVAEDLPGRSGQRISLHAGAGEGSPQWLLPGLTIGDEVSIRIVEPAEGHTLPSICNFCGREPHDIEKLFQGPASTICDRCISDFDAALTSGKRLPLGAMFSDEQTWGCGFCEKRPDAIPGVIVRNGAAICPQCLHACSDIAHGLIDTKT